jgi:XTP/dITP diphosphohydrolase
MDAAGRTAPVPLAATSPQGSGGESPLVELVEVFRRLRAECAWKAAQTHRSLARHLIEETYEVVEAIEARDPEHLREELGDVLLQVYLHAANAAEAGDFDIEDVAAELREKMLRRNPHVFDDGAETETDPARVNEVWESAKAEEKQRSDVLEGIPLALPGLNRAAKVLDRLERDGREVRVDAGSSDVGERLLAVVDEARRAGVDPEQALRDAVRRLA